MPDPKDNLTYPNRREEDQDVEMEPVVLGPGAYSSPDPATESARLLPLDVHPMAEDISEDYGTQPEAVAEESAEENGEGYAAQTVADLKDEARDRDIEGFSTMNKAELVAALEASDEES